MSEIQLPPRYIHVESSFLPAEAEERCADCTRLFAEGELVKRYPDGTFCADASACEAHAAGLTPAERAEASARLIAAAVESLR